MTIYLILNMALYLLFVLLGYWLSRGIKPPLNDMFQAIGFGVLIGFVIARSKQDKTTTTQS